MKYFNTAGPVNRPDHYKVDPLSRWNLDEIISLINQEKYFILHAPRQTGKTSSMLALRDYLNAEGKYLSEYVNIEPAQAARNNVAGGLHAILGLLSENIKKHIVSMNNYDPDYWKNIIKEHSEYEYLTAYLAYISQCSSKPFVLFIDEIDALVGDTLVSVLRQIRSGYDKRPAAFPSTIVLCGVRDIQDYRIHRSNEDIITGGSAFNIKAESLRLGNFTIDDVKNLYNQHTRETGQIFDDGCFDLIWKYTAGQPWLVNALAYEVTFKMTENRDPKVIITPQKIEEAKERLILSRQTHLDQLADKLSEDRVRRVILPMIMGEEEQVDKDDEQYCYDLGLIRKTGKGFIISNDIYREVIPRELTESRQNTFLSRFDPEWVNKDGSINSETMITLFRDFWIENSDIWASHIKGYQEAAPQLVIQAFLQRVANGSGYVAREYAAGRGRTDLMLKWKYLSDGEIKWQKIVIEIKTINAKQNYDKIKTLALKQTSEYAVTCGADESHIFIFDRDEHLGWREKVFTDQGDYNGISMKIWGM